MRCIAAVSRPSAQMTTATGLPKNGRSAKTSTCLNFTSVLVHDALGALGIDDRLGEAVHRLDFFLAAVLRPGAGARGEQLGDDLAAHFRDQRVQAVVRLGN